MPIPQSKYRPGIVTAIIYGVAANIPRKEGASGVLQGLMMGSGFVVLVCGVMSAIIQQDLLKIRVPLPPGSAITGVIVALTAGGLWYHSRRPRFLRNARYFLGTPERRAASRKRGWMFFAFVSAMIGLKIFMVM
jgi:hypothetical protein